CQQRQLGSGPVRFVPNSSRPGFGDRRREQLLSARRLDGDEPERLSVNHHLAVRQLYVACLNLGGVQGGAGLAADDRQAWLIRTLVHHPLPNSIERPSSISRLPRTE